MKTVHAKFSIVVWCISGIWILATTDNGSFISWQALVFFLVGIFAVSLTFGLVFYLLQRAVGKFFGRLLRLGGPLPLWAVFIKGIGFFIFSIEAVAIFLTAKWVMGRLFA